ncbi:MAG: polysaccharide biosynthesis protein [Kiritimatiellaeota bacterium]|nr:polysaccharide biosynthesis protein [Kiritimatiellota bacterium]
MAGFALLDTAVMALAYCSAFALRFDFMPKWGWGSVASSFVVVWLAQAAALFAFGCHRLLWRYVGAGDAPRFVAAVGGSTAVLTVLRLLLPLEKWSHVRPPFSIIFFNAFLLAGGLLSVRLIWRMVAEGGLFGAAPQQGKVRKLLFVGAGSAGNMAAREFRRRNAGDMRVVGFVDDDPSKGDAQIQGYPVLGTVGDLPHLVRRHDVDEVVIAIARASREVIRRIVMLCETTKARVRIIPGYFELIEGSMTASKIRNVEVTDLLGRAETQSDAQPVISLFSRKRVLITGAGGSIGSELVRQVLRTGPERLVLVERSENALYEIDRELRTHGMNTVVTALLGDVADRARMAEVMGHVRPHIIIHAAAYKHVPMSERNPVEAVKNNVLATRALGELALAQGVERFVLVSTDKAVNPVSVMGTTKRLAEIVLQDLNIPGRTRFSAVRFGNVLDSSGSVVPLFREQIKNGEPLTVTHPEMRRYFMTISEAVSLVLQAAALAKGGEIFVLDMGEPVRILDLAQEMIALSGLRPYEDVPILFTGIRPGEKLFEELDVSERSAYQTGHARIFISKIDAADAPPPRRILDACAALCAEAPPPEAARERIRNMLSGGTPPPEENTQ